jgi:hypothetical protein
MSTFTEKKITAINGREPFYQLVIDGKGVLDEFENDIRSNPQYTSEMKTLYTYMEHLSNGNRLPIKKYRELKTSNSSPHKEFEFKSKHLRVYGIKSPDGRIIIKAGYKDTQTEDINSMESLTKRYSSSRKN